MDCPNVYIYHQVSSVETEFWRSSKGQKPRPWLRIVFVDKADTVLGGWRLRHPNSHYSEGLASSLDFVFNNRQIEFVIVFFFQCQAQTGRVINLNQILHAKSANAVC